MIDFKRFTASNLLSFGFNGLPIHQKLIVRARVYTDCTTQNKAIQMTLDGLTDVVIPLVLVPSTETIIEG